MLLIVVRSFLALKSKMGLEIGSNVLKISGADPLTIGQTWWLFTVRRGRRFGYVASIGLPFDALALAQGRPIMCHQSLSNARLT